MLIPTIKIHAPGDPKNYWIVNESDFNPDVHVRWGEYQGETADGMQTEEVQKETKEVEPKRGPIVFEIDPQLLTLSKQELMELSIKEFGIKIDPRKKIENMAKDICEMRALKSLDEPQP